MSEEFQDKPTEKLDLQQYLALARRRYWYFVIPFFVGWVLVFAASWVIPPVYRSGALIVVEQPIIPQQYVVPTDSTRLEDRLDSMTQQILSRSRLLDIIQKLNLYAKQRAYTSTDNAIERMRKDIKIELVRSETQQVTAFHVYFAARDPLLAQSVTNELTNLFIKQNFESRRKQAEDTTSFLEAQLEQARSSLAEQEERLRKYKDQYLGELPGQLQSNIQILSGLQNQLQQEQDALSRANQQNVYLQSLLSQYRSRETPSPGTSTTPLGLAAVDQELDKLHSQLADLTSHYTDRHPDVRKIKDQIAKTERMKQRITADLQSKAAASESYATTSELPTNDGTDKATSEISSQLKANKIEIANREQSIKELQGKIAEYQGRLNQTPVREQQLADITRDYDQSRANYESLLSKKNQSELAANLEREQVGETFRVIDPPSLPSKPYFPDRLKMALMAVFGGLVLGVVSAGAMEFLDDRVYNETDLKRLLPATVLTEIPPVLTLEDKTKQRRMVWIGVLAGGLVTIVMLAGTAFSYLRG